MEELHEEGSDLHRLMVDAFGPDIGLVLFLAILESDREMQRQSQIEEEAVRLVDNGVVHTVEEATELAWLGYQRPSHTLADNRAAALEVLSFPDKRFRAHFRLSKPRFLEVVDRVTNENVDIVFKL